MADTLRIGMIGCGGFAAASARGIAEAVHAEHVMVMDTNEDAARSLGRIYGVPHTTSVEELLANPQVQAVYLAVPHDLHAPLTIRALQAGKHVLVEKPIATTLPDADAMIAAAEQAGRVLALTFQAQTNPSLQRIRALIAQGAIGRVLGTHIVYRLRKPDSYWQSGAPGHIQSHWRASRARSGGGILMMNVIHELNTMRYLTGLEVTRVSCEYDTYATPVEVEDYIAVTYRYTNGAIGSVEAGSRTVGQDPLSDAHRIYGEKGQIILSHPRRIFLAEEAAGLKTGEWLALDEDEADNCTLVVEGFARAVLSGTAPPVTGHDGRAALEIVLAAYQAGREHRVVELPL